MLYVKANCLKKFVFAVFNRWGEKVFETNDPANGWNGQYRGANSDTGVFAYELIATTIRDQKITGTEILHC